MKDYLVQNKTLLWSWRSLYTSITIMAQIYVDDYFDKTLYVTKKIKPWK